MAKCDLEATTDSFDEAIDELARRVSIHFIILLRSLPFPDYSSYRSRRVVQVSDGV